MPAGMVGEPLKPDGVADHDVIQSAQNGAEERAAVTAQFLLRQAKWYAFSFIHWLYRASNCSCAMRGVIHFHK